MARYEGRNTTRHREAGAASRVETRRRLLESAAREFAAAGYAATTVTRIAAGAGVTVQTLYLAWGSKRALLRAYMDAALAGVRDVSDDDVRPALLADAPAPADPDPRAAIEGVTHLYRQVAEHVAIGWQLYRDAAATDPAIAADWQHLQRLRRRPFQTLVQSLPPTALRSDLTTDDAADTAWAIASPDTYEVLVRHGGYSLDDYEAWVARTLAAALLAPDTSTRKDPT